MFVVISFHENLNKLEMLVFFRQIVMFVLIFVK